MFPDVGQPGAVLAAATARALDASNGSSDLEDGSSSDGEGPGDLFLEPSPTEDVSSDDDRLGQVASVLSGQAGYIAVAASPTLVMPPAPPQAASTALIVYGQLTQVFDDRLSREAPMRLRRVECDVLPHCGDLMNSRIDVDDACEPCREAGMQPTGAASATSMVVPMDVNQVVTWPTGSHVPLPPHLVLRLGGKIPPYS